MAKKVDWIPRRYDDFFNKQRVYLDRVVANKVAWGISNAAITPLLTLQAEYEPLYWKVQDKKARTGGDVVAHRDCHKRYAAAWRAFHKEWVAGNRSIPKSELAILVGKERDTEPSPHPAITDIPIVALRVIGGGDIDVRCKALKDQTRPSMHPAANLIDYRYVLLEIGDIPPADPEDYQKRDVSSRAKFIIRVGAKNEGKRFYAVARWVNTTKPKQEGPWTEAVSVVIA
jgi:hypothetical protein